MPDFLESQLKQEYGSNSSIPYKVMNKMGAMHGNKITDKGRAMERKHNSHIRKMAGGGVVTGDWDPNDPYDPRNGPMQPPPPPMAPGVMGQPGPGIGPVNDGPPPMEQDAPPPMQMDQLPPPPPQQGTLENGEDPAPPPVVTNGADQPQDGPPPNPESNVMDSYLAAVQSGQQGGMDSIGDRPNRTPFTQSPNYLRLQAAGEKYAELANKKQPLWRGLVGGLMTTMKPTRPLAQGVMHPGLANAAEQLKGLKGVADEERLAQTAESNEELKNSALQSNDAYRRTLLGTKVGQTPASPQSRARWIATINNPNSGTEEVLTAKANLDEDDRRNTQRTTDTAQARKDVSTAPGKPITSASDPRFVVAQQLAYGKLTMADFQRLYSYSRDSGDKTEIFKLATQMNSAFNPASMGMGYKLASNPRVQLQLASLDNVEMGVPDLIKFSDEASRTGITAINRIVNPLGFEVGGKTYSDFHTAVTAFADELSGALGYGSATDMSREMGFAMTNPNLSPEKFASAMREIVVPFAQRKRSTMLHQMGVYGQQGMNPGATPMSHPEGAPTGATPPAGGPPATGPAPTATNPTTGEKVQFVNGNWVPMGAK